jgi:hypothetical protein
MRKPPPKQDFNFKRTVGELQETLSNRSFFALFITALLSAVAAEV